MIEIKSKMGKTEVLLDGKSISGKICDMRLHFIPCAIPTMELELLTVDGLDIEMDNAIINVIYPEDSDSKEEDTQGKQGTHIGEDFIIHMLADAFEQPCNIGLNGIQIDEWMLENEAEWCEEHCGKATNFECWKKFLESYKTYIDSWHEE